MICNKFNCGGEIRLKKMVFRNGKIHLKSWCPNCGRGKYWKQTPENLKLFEGAKIKKSAGLEEAEAIQFERSPESVMGRFGSDYELLFAKRLKEKYIATILKRGCPDFFVECNGKIFFVEVKHKGDKLSRYQKKFKEMLEKIGAKVFISKEGDITKEIENYLIS